MLAVKKGTFRQKLERRFLHLGAPICVLFQGVLIILFWNKEHVSYLLTAGTAANFAAISYLHFKDIRNPLKLLPYLGSIQIQVPIFVMGMSKTFIQMARGIRVDFVRTSREIGGSLIPIHYKGIFLGMILTHLMSYIFGNNNNPLDAGFRGLLSLSILTILLPEFLEWILQFFHEVRQPYLALEPNQEFIV